MRKVLDFTARLTQPVAAISSVGPRATVIEVRHRPITSCYYFVVIHMRSHSTLPEIFYVYVTLHAHDACALPREMNIDDVVRLQLQIYKLSSIGHVPHFTTHESPTSAHQS